MHGLVNRSIQCFLRDTYGSALWLDVARDTGLGAEGFEAMLGYDDAMTVAVVDAAAARLERPRETLLEDLGTYLVSHPNLENLRRLLRFGGVSFTEFLHSLDDLPDRARLALPELNLPPMTLRDAGEDRFVLLCRAPVAGMGHVAVGLLRAIADDYGSLVVIDHAGATALGEAVVIHLLEPEFATGKQFDLALRAG